MVFTWLKVNERTSYVILFNIMTMDINFLLKTYLYQPLESVWKINDKTIAFYFKHSVFPWLVFSLDNQSPAMFYGLHTHKLSELLLHKHPIDSFLQSKILQTISLTESGYVFSFNDDQEVALNLLFSSMPYHPTLSLIKQGQPMFQSHPKAKDVHYSIMTRIVQHDLYSLVLEEAFHHLSLIFKTYLRQKQKRLVLLAQDKARHESYKIYANVAEEAMVNTDLPIATLNDNYSLNLPMHTFSNRGEFINFLFHQVKRSKQGVLSVNNQVEKLTKEIEILSSFFLSVQPFSIDHYQQLRQRLEELHLLTTKVKKPMVVKAENPYIFTYKDTTYSFGKNQKQNHHLTFHLAQKKHIFVHIKDFPGSHIIIHRADENHEALIFAGQLALYLSKQKSGDITYAKVGSLKSTHTQGMVIVKNGKTMKINLDYALKIDDIITQAKRY